MDKNAIKKYAVWAREELIRRVSAKMEEYGVSKENPGDAGADAVDGRLLSKVEKAQRQRLIAQVKKDGYEQVVEEVAYTWFNRFIALRFMEVNGVLPSHVRVFTDENDAFRPQILAEALHLELDGLDMDYVIALKQTNDTDALYKYLLITQCNALNNVFPQMFQKIEDYTELLFPDNILREGSVIHRMVTDIPEDNWRDQVQIIGWLYQYYNTEPKAKVFARPSGQKIKKEEVPAATQLFTPDWIVRYMVENSLGRLWIEHKRSNSSDDTSEESFAHTYMWDYYLPEVEQDEAVQMQLEQIRTEYRDLKPEDIKVIDPCMGSGHILVYAFDVLFKIYIRQGYTPRDTVRSILENNLYGLDIDDRATQLAYFSVMMKAVSYDSRFLRRSDIPQPHVHAILESNALGGSYKLAMGDFLLSKEHQETLNYLLDAFLDAKEYGSLLQLEDRDYTGLMEAWKYTASQTAENVNMVLWYSAVEHEIPKLIEQAIVLTQKYDVVVTNPPYMGAAGMGGSLSEYVRLRYANTKSDLFSTLIQKMISLTKANRSLAFVVPQSLLFLSTQEGTRKALLEKMSLKCMIDLGLGAFDAGFGTVSAVFWKSPTKNANAICMDLTGIEDKETAIQALTTKKYICATSTFDFLPNSIFSYSCTEVFRKCFNLCNINKQMVFSPGIKTGNNNLFVRLWYEISLENFAYSNASQTDLTVGRIKWFKYSQGGGFHKWYGTSENVVDMGRDAYNIRTLGDKSTYRLRNKQFYFVDGIAWPMVGTTKFSCRYLSADVLPDIASNSLYSNNDFRWDILAYMNSVVFNRFMQIINPTVNYPIESVNSVPFYELDATRKYDVDEKCKHCVQLAKLDWDSFETSWDFARHPLVRLRMAGAYAWSDSQPVMKISSAYKAWELECEGRFNQLKANEEELNRIFIDIYGLQDELTPEVEDRDVTVRKADLGRDIRSLISYAVGCMFGRYSPYQEGLIFAGGEWDYNKFENLAWQAEGKPDVLKFHKAGTHFFPDLDNIIPICDDEYFADDIVGRFVEFISIVYGGDDLEENLKFIADTLGGKGTPLDVIRNYFLNDFYADHCKIYQKRPIYWLFDSGKKNGFKALVYLHRYQPDLLARMRTDYVHEQQARYRTAIDDLERRIAGASTAERVKLDRQLAKLKDQDSELRGYEEKIHHLADQMIAIDLDDGVKVNYSKFKDVLAKIK